MVHTVPGQMALGRDEVVVKGMMDVPEEAEVDSPHRKEEGKSKVDVPRHRPNQLRIGAGGVVPRMAPQSTMLSSSSSPRSSSVKSIRADRAAVADFSGLRRSSGILGFSAV